MIGLRQLNESCAHFKLKLIIMLILLQAINKICPKQTYMSSALSVGGTTSVRVIM